jgi:hypothetical protein
MRPLSHAAHRTAQYVRLAGRQELLLRSFRVDNGPDLRVWLVPGRVGSDADVGEHVDLGSLKGNVGNQRYRIPADVDTGRFSHVVIWCRAFTTAVATADLSAAAPLAG